VVPYLSDKKEGNQSERAQAGGQQSQSTFASAGGNCEFFQLKSWEEARTKFGHSVGSERLLRFRVKLMLHHFTFKTK